MKTQIVLTTPNKEGYFFGEKRNPAKSMLFPTLVCSAKRIFQVTKDQPLFSREQEEFIFEESNKIINTYSGESRFYHNLSHPFSFLEMLETNTFRRLVQSPDLLVIASVFHDYDENVFASACFAREFILRIGGGMKQAEIVFDLIMDTEHKDFAKSYDGRILADMDLYPLSLPRAEFENNTNLLYKEVEYKKSREDFNADVRSFFEMLSERKRIFQTTIFEDFEKIAIENIENSSVFS